MAEPRVIMFTFAGRQPNMELQLPFVRRILEQHPNVEFHVWNLARKREDNWWLRSLRGDRITVRNDFYRLRHQGFAEVYKHYATHPGRYEDFVFVKLDDDAVFLQTDRFADFVAAVQDNPGQVVSANVINNGACARVDPELFRRFKALGKPLLDWHLHLKFAQLAHDYFFDNWRDILAQPIEVAPTKDWCSINCIGMDYHTLVKMAAGLGGTPPAQIAGRDFTGDGHRLGDEGACNMAGRVIVKGFTVCHLAFGPQTPTPTQLSQWRAQYAAIGAEYLTPARQPQTIG